jgi:Ca2+-binding EF-hand superfamily protein
MGGGGSKHGLSKSQIQKFVKETGFSESELQFLYLRFNGLCSNGKSLSKKDLERDTNLKSNPYISRVFNTMPKNGLGDVVFDNFVKTASIFREGQDLKKKLKFIFGLFDSNMDDTLDVDEIKLMITSFNPGISDGLRDEMVNETVRDVACYSRKSEQDGKIRSDDFVAYASQMPGIETLLVLNFAADVS